MKRRIVMIAVVLGLAVGLFQLRTSAQQPNDEQQRARQEVAVMKSILQTTLDFASQSMDKKQGGDRHPRPFGFSQITGLYLRGQGAVFTIPISGVGAFGDHNFDFNFVMPEVPEIETGEAGQISVTVPTPVIAGDASDEEMARVEAELQKAQKDLEKEQTKAAEAKVKAKENLQRRMELLKQTQENMKRRQQDLEKRRADLTQRIDRLKVYLRDALANHADSLSIVKPQEYVTFVITTDGPRGWFGDNGGDDPAQQVMSVKKSDVVEFKSGRITREQFAQRILEYQF